MKLARIVSLKVGTLTVTTTTTIITNNKVNTLLMKLHFVLQHIITRILVTELVKEQQRGHLVDLVVGEDFLEMDFLQLVNSSYGYCHFQVCCVAVAVSCDNVIFVCETKRELTGCISNSLAVFFLLASLAQRKKMSKTEAVLEEAAIKSAGIDKKYIPRIFVGVAVFIILLILFRRKILTWFFLIGVNVALLAYWIHLKNKADERAASNDYQMYGGTAA